MKNTESEVAVKCVKIAAIRCLKNQPESSNGIFVVLRTFRMVQADVKILLINIITNREFMPVLGVKNRISPILRKESQKLNISRFVCLPRPLRIPQETESINITGENNAITKTDFEMCGAE